MIDAVVAWHPDRLHRSPKELETFIDAVEATSARVATVLAGTYDLSSATGLMVARVVGATSRFESDHKSERARRKHQELAELGQVGGGGNRPYGFERDRVTHRELEVAIIREAADRVLRDESIYSIVLDLAQRGVPTSTGAKWSGTALKQVLTNPRIAGLREHRGAIVGPAVWEPVLPESTWLEVCAILRARGGPTPRRGGKYLLSGLLRCGLCGRGLVATPRGSKKPDQGSIRAYGCAQQNGGCGKVFILAQAVERYVADLLFAAFTTNPDWLSRNAEGRGDKAATDSARLLSVDAKLAALARLWGEGEITEMEWLAARTPLVEEASLLRVRLDATIAPKPAADLLVDLPARWDDLAKERKRTVLEVVFQRIDVQPAGNLRNRFDPERVHPVWRV